MQKGGILNILWFVIILAATKRIFHKFDSIKRSAYIEYSKAFSNSLRARVHFDLLWMPMDFLSGIHAKYFPPPVNAHSHGSNNRAEQYHLIGIYCICLPWYSLAVPLFCNNPYFLSVVLCANAQEKAEVKTSRITHDDTKLSEMSWDLNRKRERISGRVQPWMRHEFY